MPKHWWIDHREGVAADEHSSSESHDFHYAEKPNLWQRIKPWQKFGGGALLLVTGIVIWLWFAIAQGMPTLDQLENPHPELATQLISSDGERLDP